MNFSGHNWVLYMQQPRAQLKGILPEGWGKPPSPQLPMSFFCCTTSRELSFYPCVLSLPLPGLMRLYLCRFPDELVSLPRFPDELKMNVLLCSLLLR